MFKKARYADNENNRRAGSSAILSILETIIMKKRLDVI
jgi:hypothetical protein